MLSIAHATTGAVLATNLPSPLAVPLILASHYALDAIYHYDAGTGLSRGYKTRRVAFILGVIDLVLAVVIVIVMYPPPFIIPWSLVLDHFSGPPYWGALLGLLPDFLESPRNFLHYEPIWLKPINRFHASFHHSIPNIAAGLAPQIILLTLLWIWR